MARLDTAPAEWNTSIAPETERVVRQYTSAEAHSYPLYYFIPSITPDNRYMVFHSERSGSVQLHRLDMADGSTLQLTEGSTVDSGWAIWCDYHLNGVYNHLSALNVVSGEVYYFDHEELRAVDIVTCTDRLVATLPGRLPVGQSVFSPDGRWFAFVDTDAEVFARQYAERQEMEEQARFCWNSHHDAWRATVPTRIGLVDTSAGEVSTVIDLDFYVHHVLFVDNEVLLVNHPRQGSGMWTVSISGAAPRTLRDGNPHGGACHQVVAGRGLLYETSGGVGKHAGECWFGSYNFADDTCREWRLPLDIGYVHTGNDPDGEFLVIESCSSTRHGLYQVLPRSGDEIADVSLLKSLNPDVFDRLDRQRHHAHPFLGPDRRQLFYTDVIDGYSQICSVDVSDLTAANA